MPKVDDKAVAQNVWTVCCAKCSSLIEPEQNAIIGRCPKCGHTFSQMRLLTRAEIRQFLAGRLSATIKIDGREHLRDVRGLQDLSADYLEHVREAIATMQRLQSERLARRRQGRVRGEAYVIPRVTRHLESMERGLHELAQKTRPRRRAR